MNKDIMMYVGKRRISRLEATPGTVTCIQGFILNESIVHIDRAHSSIISNLSDNPATCTQCELSLWHHCRLS